MTASRKLNIIWHFGIVAISVLVHGSGIVAQVPCEPVVLSDTAVINYLIPNPSDRIPGAEYRACVRKGSSEVLVVFRDGTQISELSSQETERFLQSHSRLRRQEKADPGYQKTSWAEQLSGEESFLGVLLNDGIPVKEKLKTSLELGLWTTGFSVSNGVDFASSRALVIRNTVHLEYLGELFSVYAGVGFHGSSFHGSLAGELQSDSLNHFRNGSFSWTVGLPFIRYEMKQAGWVIPEYFWLEDDMLSVLDLGEQGETLAEMSRRWGKGHKGNVGHALYTKAGHFRFDMYFDGDLYRTSVLRMSLDSLPFIFGTWGVSLTKASDVWIPGAWIETPGLSGNLFTYSGFEVPFAVEPLRFHFHYWNLRRYNVGFTTGMSFDLKKSRQETIDEQ